MTLISKAAESGPRLAAACHTLNGTFPGKNLKSGFKVEPASASRNSSMLKMRKISSILPHKHRQVMAYIASCQPGYRLIYVSPQISNLGFSQEAWLSEMDLRLQQVHEDDFDRVSLALRHSRSSGEKFNCYYRLYDSSGKVRWLHDEARVVHDESGSPLFSSGVMLDITDKKEMETQLHEYRYSLDRHVMHRTGQLLKRMAMLESCNASLGEKIASALREITFLKQKLSVNSPEAPGMADPAECTNPSDCAQKMIAITKESWIKQGGYKPKVLKTTPAQSIPAPAKISAAEQLDSLSDWARQMIGWRVTAAGTIA
jgi:PAS domain S-box-containing protein